MWYFGSGWTKISLPCLAASPLNETNFLISAITLRIACVLSADNLYRTPEGCCSRNLQDTGHICQKRAPHMKDGGVLTT